MNDKPSVCNMETLVECHICEGKGWIGDEGIECTECGGVGSWWEKNVKYSYPNGRQYYA